MKKKVLFVINTMGRAGAETALLELLRRIDKSEYEVSLFVLTGQGEMLSQIPDGVKLVNKNPDMSSVHDDEGRKHLRQVVMRSLSKDFNGFKLLPYFATNGIKMLQKKNVLPDKLLWRAISDSASRTTKKYDYAIAYIEGAAAYYVADHVNAEKKIAFIHIDYEKAGYTRELDKDCYLQFDKIFGVSQEVTDVFLKVYPELKEKTGIFHNMLNCERIREKADLGDGFTDGFTGTRILTIGRLMKQKAFEVSIKACRILKDKGENIRWYVLGEGDQREKLTEYIKKLGLEEDFLLLGSTDNPYPYLKQADLYVHCSRYEGKSIAVQEAQILGKPIIVSDCSGNREQVIPEENGLICNFTSKDIAESVIELIHDKEKRDYLANNALKVNGSGQEEVDKLFDI